jgi:hypothetical protein
MVFESNQITFTDKFERWYKDWKEPNVEIKRVVGAYYKEDETTTQKGANLHDDMVEAPEGWEGYVETGAEHNGWRSKRGLEAICREAETCYDYQE